MFRRILLTWGLLFTLACGSPTPAALTIVHFNDVYEIGPGEGGRVGGLARVATVIKDLRRTNSPVVTTLGGDYLSPSALSIPRVDGEPIAGRQMVDVLNALGLEWATLGNHEFDLPEAAFRARLTQGKFPIITSNITDGNGAAFANTKDFAIVPVQVGGRSLKLGLIGLTMQSDPKTWVRYGPVVEGAKAAIAKMRAAGKVDAIIALTHLPMSEDQALVTAVPEIDLSLGGHEHENFLLYRGSALTPIVKADANVRTLAIITMTFPDRARPAISVRLQPITDAITADATVDAEVKRWTTTAFDAYRKDGFQPDRVVATLPHSLDGRQFAVRNTTGNLTMVIMDALAREAKPDVVIMNGGSIRIDDELPAGPVTEYDVIRILPFGGAVTRVTMPGSLLLKVLDAGEKNVGTGGFLSTWGVAKDRDRVMVQSKPLNPSTRYTVAMPEYLMTGREANLPFLTRTNPLIRPVEDLRDIRQALIAELSAKFPVK
ncbi:MAG TPA: bifunctional metallophosphatase/5'-nucleotidase [Vicinamibacterales bacterium]|nr:bifunctional metallophosphatase/5'-nucleotidase [Vicinamibacterales bacterium]